MSKLLVALALAATALPTAVTAQDIHVRYADLDLGSPAGVAELDRRMMMSSVASQRERVVAQANPHDGTSLSAR